MDITKLVAKLRLEHHMNMLNYNNILNQLHIRDDETAEEKAKYHFMECVDCLERLGKDVSEYKF